MSRGPQPHVIVQLIPPWERTADAGIDSLWSVGRVLNDRGTVMDPHAVLGESLEAQLSEAEASVCGWNGFFGVVAGGGNHFRAVTDRIRGWPIFYAIHENTLIICNSAEWIRDHLSLSELDPLRAQEFVLSGYVTGSHTLFRQIHQVQAGEIVDWTFSEGRWRTSSVQYTAFLPYAVGNGDAEALEAEHAQVMRASIDRLLTFADGRQIAIPLSGGLDSRLLAYLIRDAGYDNVVAFSYGRPGNQEAQVSSWIADQLRMDWGFVKYSRRNWWGTWHSEEFDQYRDFAGNWSSLPHIQDFPAVRALLDRGFIQPNAVVVPGHSGDFTAGSHIPSIHQGAHDSTGQSVQALLRHGHYSLQGPAPADSRLPREMLTEWFAGSTMQLDRLHRALRGSSSYEAWDWRERQAKYIVNSVRVYDYVGLGWWLPFWDKFVFDYWQRVPLNGRRGTFMYKAWVNRLTGEPQSGPKISEIRRKIVSTLARASHTPSLTGLRSIAGIGLSMRHPLAFDFALFETPGKALVTLPQHLLHRRNILGIITMFTMHRWQEKLGSQAASQRSPLTAR